MCKRIKWEKNEKTTQVFNLVLTNDVLPRDSQDDKILPEHPKFNPNVKSFESWNYRNL